MDAWMNDFYFGYNKAEIKRKGLIWKITICNQKKKKKWAEAQGLFLTILYYLKTLVITDNQEHL